MSDVPSGHTMKGAIMCAYKLTKPKKRGYSAIEERPRCLENPVQLIRRWERNVRYVYQRVRYGYCDRDVWSIDLWFLNVVPNMLQDLREMAHGYPDVLVKADTPNIRNGSESDEASEQGAQRWDAILAEMIHWFREADEDTCEMKNPYEEKYEEIMKHPQEEKYEEIMKLYMQEWRRIDEYRDECKNKGLELFSKWFWHLWD